MLNCPVYYAENIIALYGGNKRAALKAFNLSVVHITTNPTWAQQVRDAIGSE